MIQGSEQFLSHNIVDGKAETCVWDVDGQGCEGDIHIRHMFKKQLVIPVCDKHYIKHVMLMCINNKKLFDVEIEALVDAEDWARVELFKSEFGEGALTTSVLKKIHTKLLGADDNLNDDEIIEKILEEIGA